MSFRIRGLSLGAIGKLAIRSLRSQPPAGLHVFICIADHYEPMWNGAPIAQQDDRVSRWTTEYPRLAAKFQDSRDRTPQHTFFWPAEEYNANHIERLAELCRKGHGDVEVHLHHDNDTSAGLRNTLEEFKRTLHDEHGLLAKDEQGQITYGFVHGNWALDNSLPDGRWCGVNDEITVLRETGCYADFTMPSVPDPAQTSTINSIYYAVDDPHRPKSHDKGVAARVGSAPPDDGLLMIQGPTMFDWTKRRFIVPPGLENGDLHATFPPCERRLKLWLKAGIGVSGRPDWIFIKLHTHGAPESNASILLGEPMRLFHATLARWRNTYPTFSFYYVTAREMATLVHQAEQGVTIPSFSAQCNGSTTQR
jgi:hypothetical protein